jgi:integrase/recombinase XerD
MQTGLRLSEITAVRPEDIILGSGAHIHCVGKGRKERGTLITKVARRVLHQHREEEGDRSNIRPCFSALRAEAHQL